MNQSDPTEHIDPPTQPERLIDDVVRRGALAVLESGRKLDRWDLAPTLMLVAEGPDHPLCISVPVPFSLWQAMHPMAVLHNLAHGLSIGAIGLEPPVPPGEIRGAVLITEGHNIAGTDLTDAENATLDDFKKNHRLEEHPKARELRMAQMIDRSLTVVIAEHFRGEEVSDRIVYGCNGRMTEALDRFITTVFAVWMEQAT